ncbi:MAG TPA: DUF3179 domain-containing protein [Thermoanaerobaculia bacterium]
MKPGTILPLFLLLTAAALPAQAPRTPLSPSTGYALARIALSGSEAARRQAAGKLAASGDPAWIAPLVDALFFLHADEREPVLAALRKLAGEDPGPRYQDWVELLGRRTGLVPPAGYLDWKGQLFGRIDPHYRALFKPSAMTLLRPEEIVWGGVHFDGIPALDEPPHVPADAEHALDEREEVFGLSLGGEQRAYPLRYVSWHEVVNDTLGGKPVALTYCALCRSGIAWSAKNLTGGRHIFATSGLIYHSDKLMIDRATQTLWLQITGEPVLGPLAANPAPLTMLPLTLTTWGAWKRLHPDTTVLQLTAAFGARWGYRYTPGAADLAREGVAFPVWQRSRLLEQNELVFGVRVLDRAKAWPVNKIIQEGVLNDRLGRQEDTNLVLLGDPDSRAVRAYRRTGHTFKAGPDPSTVLDEAGRPWVVTEESLLPPAGAEDAKPLARLPGHVAFWFAWFGFHPQTEVWGTP